jgi:hypothetical protein
MQNHIKLDEQLVDEVQRARWRNEVDRAVRGYREMGKREAGRTGPNLFESLLPLNVFLRLDRGAT